jgi:hypothetical protein
LLVLMWLQKYLHEESLALWFDVDPSTVTRIINRVIAELWSYFQNQIRWPNVREWANLMGNWPEFPNAVGSIDATPHEIYRPITLRAPGYIILQWTPTLSLHEHSTDRGQFGTLEICSSRLSWQHARTTQDLID